MTLIKKFQPGGDFKIETPFWVPPKGNITNFTEYVEANSEENPILNSPVISPEYKETVVKRRDSKINQKGNAGKIAALQDQLFNLGAFGDLDYKVAVDAQMGPLTRAALAKAAKMGYTLDKVSGKLTKEPVKELAKEELKTQEKPSLVEKIKGFSFNHPAVEAVSDLVAASINRAGKAVLGEGTTLIQRPNVTSLPQNQIDILRDMIKQHGGEPKGGFSSSDWRRYQGTYTGKNRSLLERMSTPSGKIEHTLGQFNWYTNDNGDIIITDTYDWNTGEGTPNNGMYSKLRAFMGEHGSKDTDPDQWKRHYKINIGKLS